jgi:hypothetical protein
MAKNGNPVKHMSGKDFQDVRLTTLEEKAQFVGETSPKGKEVNRSLREEGITEGEEHALIRKAIMHLITKHGDQNDPELAEFIAFYNKVEAAKAVFDENQNRGV